ncbi:MAG: GntR family transcriptional regulator [Pseudomonadaceae bacterium]|nr:GntR family transcriptional regulator [Pseudomonadaceae bacterium]
MNFDDNQPIYLQLRQLVAGQILSGTLAEGEAIPSVRQVASEERINPLTVSKAYQLLVDDGLLEKRRGLGMFVTGGAKDKALELERERFLNDTWPATRQRIKDLGLNLKTLLDGDKK